MSRPERSARSYSPEDILKALKSGESPKQIALADQGFPYSSRLAVLMTESGSNAFYMSRATIRQRTNPVDDAEMMRGFATVERWGLFERRADGKHRRVYRPKETPKEFKRRVLQKIDAELAILCITSDITTASDKPAPHSISEFAAELGCTRMTVIRCVKTLVEDGYIVGWARGSTRRSLWARPDCTSVIYNLDKKYDHNRIGTDPRYRLRRSPDEVRDWLRDILSEGPLLFNEIKVRARWAGYSMATVNQAAEELGIEKVKDGYQGPWRWVRKGRLNRVYR